MYLEPQTAAVSQAAPLPTIEVQVPEGMNGIRETLKVMQRFAVEGSRNPVVRQLAQRELILSGVEPKDWAGEVRALHEYVRDRIRYVKDPVDVECVQTPNATLQLGSGDCDDKATLLAALLKTVGHPSRFVAVAFKPGELSHVYVETKIKNRWIALETTEPWAMGREPENVAGRMIKNV